MFWLYSPASDLCTLSWVIGVAPPPLPPEPPPLPPECPPPSPLSPPPESPPSLAEGSGAHRNEGSRTEGSVPPSRTPPSGGTGSSGTGTSTKPSGQKKPLLPPIQTKRSESIRWSASPPHRGSNVCAAAGKAEASKVVTKAAITTIMIIRFARLILCTLPVLFLCWSRPCFYNYTGLLRTFE